MARTNTVIFLISMTTIVLFNANANQEGDVQEEIRFMKGEIKGIKDMQEMTKMTMMAFMQQVKGVDSRVTDVAKESTLMSAHLEELSKKEEDDREKVTDLIYNVRSDHTRVGQNEENIKEITKKVQTDHTRVGQNEESIKELTRKVQTDHTRVGQNEESIKELTKNVQTDHTRVGQNDENIKELSKNVHNLTQKFEESIETLRAEVREMKERGILDKLHPVGSIYLTFINNQPPLHGMFGVLWELLPEGYTLMSASNENVGTKCGETRLDGGNTNAHALTVEEMPKHSHALYHYIFDEERWYGMWAGNKKIPYYGRTEATSESGGNKAHVHQLNVMNTKVKMWKRKS